MRLGIVGTGRIARRFVNEVKFVNGVEINCVYNPRMTSASSFAQKNNIAKFFSDYLAFLENVEAVYIASPHETHYGYAKQAIEAGKHVLCEKPICLCSAQTEELYLLSQRQNVVLQEAIKTAYLPGFRKLLEVVRGGAIGEIVDIEACFTKIEPTSSRELTDVEYGGSVTELASYVLLPIIKLLGTNYSEVHYQSRIADNGIDLYTKIVLDYGNKMALGKVGLGAKSEGELIVAGTEGYLICQAPWWLTKHFEVRDINGNTVQSYDFPVEGAGLRYEIEAFVNEICGKGSTVLTVEESIAIVGIIEKHVKTNRRSKNIYSSLLMPMP